MAIIEKLNDIQEAIKIASGNSEKAVGELKSLLRSVTQLNEASSGTVAGQVNKLAGFLAKHRDEEPTSSVVSELRHQDSASGAFAQRVHLLFLKESITDDNLGEKLTEACETHNGDLLVATLAKASESDIKLDIDTLYNFMLESITSGEDKEGCSKNCRAILAHLKESKTPLSSERHATLLQAAVENRADHDLILDLAGRNPYLTNRLYLTILNRLLGQFIANSNKRNHSLVSAFASQVKPQDPSLLSEETLDGNLLSALEYNEEIREHLIDLNKDLELLLDPESSAM